MTARVAVYLLPVALSALGFDIALLLCISGVACVAPELLLAGITIALALVFLVLIAIFDERLERERKEARN